MTLLQSDQEVDLASRHLLATALAAAFADPLTVRGQKAFHLTEEAAASSWDIAKLMYSELGEMALAPGEISPLKVSIEPLVEWLHLDLERRKTAYRHVFGFVIAKNCPLYETEYLPWKDSTFRSQQMADIAGFYHAFGLRPDPREPDRPDFLSLELDFVAYLFEKILWTTQEDGGQAGEHEAVCRDALAKFVADHATWWLPAVGVHLDRRVEAMAAMSTDEEERADILLLGRIGRILRAWIALERNLHGLPAPTRLVVPQIEPEGEEDDCADECGGGCASN